MPAVDCSCVIGTFGSSEWKELARTRAIPSAEAQGIPVIHVHDETLAASRNAGLAQVETERVIHLDADDELEEGYVEAMGKGTADVRGPIVRFMPRGGLWQPRVYGHHHDCTVECLFSGNWLVIGSAVRTQMVRDAGGWRDFHWSEDWDLWLRCMKLGATFELIRDAIYIAHVRPDSRNRAASQEAKLKEHNAIYEANFGVAA